MSVMNDIDIVLHGLVDDGIEFGYFGQYLEDYIYDQAVNFHNIPPSVAKPFIDDAVGEAKKEVFYYD